MKSPGRLGASRQLLLARAAGGEGRGRAARWHRWIRIYQPAGDVAVLRPVVGGGRFHIPATAAGPDAAPVAKAPPGVGGSRGGGAGSAWPSSQLGRGRAPIFVKWSQRRRFWLAGRAAAHHLCLCCCLLLIVPLLLLVSLSLAVLLLLPPFMTFSSSQPHGVAFGGQYVRWKGSSDWKDTMMPIPWRSGQGSWHYILVAWHPEMNHTGVDHFVLVLRGRLGLRIWIVP